MVGRWTTLDVVLTLRLRVTTSSVVGPGEVVGKTPSVAGRLGRDGCGLRSSPSSETETGTVASSFRSTNRTHQCLSTRPGTLGDGLRSFATLC